MTVPGDWEGLRARASALLAERDTALADAGAAWIEFLRARGWTRHDVECLWEGLTEDLVRRAVHDRSDTDAVRAQVLSTMATLRERIFAELDGSGAGG